MLQFLKKLHQLFVFYATGLGKCTRNYSKLKNNLGHAAQKSSPNVIYQILKPFDNNTALILSLWFEPWLLIKGIIGDSRLYMCMYIMHVYLIVACACTYTCISVH